ncbi:PAS domain-containing sensor histidine kinase [Mucilaginibacter ginsenosidivorans]|uniref:histidine kinase n=1 Tax=Mucilaginibacter ginsenosidivorans TaxID=398053 RepID=A0A5B8V1B2_9SPHI|nr:PAS domain-containing sensor histidine kinase [Mucilaginibacter ginsenosidivorans]QEC65154.1 PAS domain S-box protein [Mucilaginibacter ginsenosidivorans]
MGTQIMEANHNDGFDLAVADHISAMLAYWDKNLVCRFANTAYLDWFGKSSEQLVNKMTLMDLLGPELFAKNHPYIMRALAGSPQTFERDIPMPDGSIRPSIANYFPDIDSKGEVKGFYVHVADVTAMKILDKELQRSNQIIREQNNRLLNFANIVSHNLNTYAFNLATLLDFIDEAKTEEEKNELMGYLRAVSKNFSSTIKNLNEVADAHNQDKLKYEWLNLYDYVEKTAGMLCKQVKDTNALILNRIDTTLMLWANPAYLDSIILNFLTNALKYRHPDRLPLIELTTAVEGRELVFRIRDNGLGIDLKRHGKDIFGMYKTFHGNQDAKGIGLFITKFQTEAMGGRICVESEVNKGSTFSVYFLLKSVQLPS